MSKNVLIRIDRINKSKNDQRLIESEFDMRSKINSLKAKQKPITTDQIELALANIRAALVMCSEGDLKSELRSAEHHLTRVV